MEQKEPQVLTDEEKSAKDLCEGFFSKSLQARKPQEMIWYRNIAFFLDHQYLEWDRMRGIFRTPLAPPWRVRHVENRLKPTTLHVVAKCTKNKPVFNVLPVQADDDSLHTAMVGKIILGHVHNLNKQDILNQKIFFLSYLYGISYKDIIWDSEKGSKMLVAVDEKGQLVFGKTGDIGIEVLSPFQVVPEIGSRNEDQCQMVGKQVIQSLEYIKRKYKKYGHLVTSEGTASMSSVENQISSLINKSLNVAGHQYADDEGKEREESSGFATIKELRVKPTDKYPNGRIIRIANGIFLEETELPYKFMIENNTLGITRYPFIDIPESWYGDTPYNSLIPLQKRLNRNISAVQEILNMMCKPKYRAHKDQKLSRNTINNEFEIIEYSGPPGMNPPDVLPASEAPVSLFKAQEEDRTESWDEISMLHETSKGGQIPGINSKVAMSFLEEQDQTVYQPILTYFENKEEIVGKNVLELAKEKYVEPRKLQILGKNKEVEAYDFDGNEDIPTTVRVIPGSSFPVSQAAKQQALFQALTSGMFGPVENIPWDLKIRILSSSNIVDVDAVFEELQVDQRETRKEHQLWMKGFIRPVNIFDNHAVHIRQHDIFRKSDKYRNIQRTNPKLAMQIDEHISLHMQNDPAYLEMQKMEQEQQRQKNIQDLSIATEANLKKAEYAGKEAERRLTLMKALQGGEISKNQTVKE